MLPEIMWDEGALKDWLVKVAYMGKCEDVYAKTRMFEDTIKSSAEEYFTDSLLSIFISTHLCDRRIVGKAKTPSGEKSAGPEVFTLLELKLYF